MPNFIIGSGLVGMIAKEILGGGWEIIPQGRSRYYSFDPALADNYIAVSPAVKEIMKDARTERWQRAFSLSGHLLWQPHQWVLDGFAQKVYGETHPFLHKLWRQDHEVFSMRANDLYHWLFKKHEAEIRDRNQRYGEVQRIGDGKITTTTGTYEYDRIVSTIPLTALMQALGKPHDFKGRDVWVYLVQTDALDFEGANEVLVLEETIDFYKVVRVADFNYTFFCLKEILTPEAYFGHFTENRLVVPPMGRTHVTDAIPMGVHPPNLEWLQNDFNIQCIGSNAQWDDMVDVGTCIMRILKMRT